MKKTLILLAVFCLAGIAAAQIPEPKLSVAKDSTWHPPAPVNTPQWLACDNKLHGNWNQGVCKLARKHLTAAKQPITFDTLRVEMARISVQDQKDFDRKVEEERQRQIQRNSL